MATAEQRIRIETRFVEAVVIPAKTVTDKVSDGVILHLSQEEAQFIYNCAAMSSGVGPYRDPSNRIYYALKPFVDVEGYRSDVRGWDGHISHHGKGV